MSCQSVAGINHPNARIERGFPGWRQRVARGPRAGQEMSFGPPHGFPISAVPCRDGRPALREAFGLRRPRRHEVGGFLEDRSRWTEGREGEFRFRDQVLQAPPREV